MNKPSKTTSEAFARVIDVCRETLLGADAKDIKAKKHRFLYALAGSLTFNLSFALGAMLHTASRIRYFNPIANDVAPLPSLSPGSTFTEFSPFLVLIVSLIIWLLVPVLLAVLYAHMISHIQPAGRVRLYLSGIFLPLMVLFFISQGVAYFSPWFN